MDAHAAAHAQAHAQALAQIHGGAQHVQASQHASSARSAPGGVVSWTKSTKSTMVGPGGVVCEVAHERDSSGKMREVVMRRAGEAVQVSTRTRAAPGGPAVVETDETNVGAGGFEDLWASLPPELHRFFHQQRPEDWAPPLPLSQLPSAATSESVITMDALKARSCTTCAICCEDFQNGEQLSELPCSHTFHVQCITPWLRRSASCPCCRRVAGGPAKCVTILA